MFKHTSIFMAALTIFVLTACQPVSVEEAKAQYCADLAAFQTAMAGVQALTPDSTVDEAEAALGAADDAWDDLRSSAYTVNDAEVENLEQAYEDLDDAIRDISEGDTIQDAAASLAGEVANVNAAYDALYAVTGCE